MWEASAELAHLLLVFSAALPRSQMRPGWTGRTDSQWEPLASCMTVRMFDVAEESSLQTEIDPDSPGVY